MNKIAIIILGPQGSGKGTQATLLSQKLNAPIVKTGSLLRQEKASGSQIGREIAEYMDRGKLVPTPHIMNLIEQEIMRYDQSPIVIFDGVPRNQEQKSDINKLFTKYDFTNTMVIYLDLDYETSVKRLKKRGRYDDTDESIKNRLEFSRNQTGQVMEDYVKEKTAIYKIQANHDIETIAHDIENAYYQFSKKYVS